MSRKTVSRIIGWICIVAFGACLLTDLPWKVFVVALVVHAVTYRRLTGEPFAKITFTHSR